MIRFLSASAAILVAATLFATPQPAEARDCRVVSARAVGMSENRTSDMALRQANRRINLWTRLKDANRVWVRSYGAECKGNVVFRCKARSKACV